jgi:hypothetical protein
MAISLKHKRLLDAYRFAGFKAKGSASHLIFEYIMCATVGVRRAQRKPGRPMVIHERGSDRI